MDQKVPNGSKSSKWIILILIQRLNALGAGGGNLRTAISSEPTRKLAGNKLPVIEKTQSERSILEKTLISNAFMRNLNKEQLHKVRAPSSGLQRPLVASSAH